MLRKSYFVFILMFLVGLIALGITRGGLLTRSAASGVDAGASLAPRALNPCDTPSAIQGGYGPSSGQSPQTGGYGASSGQSPQTANPCDLLLLVEDPKIIGVRPRPTKVSVSWRLTDIPTCSTIEKSDVKVILVNRDGTTQTVTGTVTGPATSIEIPLTSIPLDKLAALLAKPVSATAIVTSTAKPIASQFVRTAENTAEY